MRAAVVATGRELLADRPDTNGPEIARALEARGLTVVARHVAPDDAAELEDALESALSRADVVVVTGGLGPTDDDVTREAVTALTGRGAVPDPAAVARIERRARELGRPAPSASSLRQALVPEGCVVLANPVGYAAGAVLRSGSGVLVLLPGPPSEMRAMLAAALDEALRQAAAAGHGAPPPPPHRVTLRVSGMGESAVADAVAGLPELADRAAIQVAWLAGAQDVELKLQGRDGRRVAAAAAACRAVLGRHVVSEDGSRLAEVVVRALVARGETLAVAESCTGGLLGGAITSVPGSSAAFVGGFVTYANEMKTSAIAVPADVLAEHGAVSREVAEAMALGARRAARADWCLSVTGIAGPGGGSEDRPVGLVHVGLAHPDGRVESTWRRLSGTREDIRGRAVGLALDTLRLALGA